MGIKEYASRPDSKDIKRAKDASHKSEAQIKSMASAITSQDKISRRYRAFVREFGPYHIFSRIIANRMSEMGYLLDEIGELAGFEGELLPHIKSKVKSKFGWTI